MKIFLYILFVIQPELTFNLNLKNRILNVSISHEPPFCSVKFDHNTGKIVGEYSTELNLLQILEQKLKFKANLLGRDNPAWGRLVNGTRWTGQFGQVYDKISEFSLCLISIYEERIRYFDFSTPVYFEQTTFMSPYRESKSYSKLDLIRPFDTLTWILLGSTCLIIITILKIKSKSSFSSITVKIIGIHFRQSQTPKIYQHETENRSNLLVYGICVLTGLILSTIYGSFYFSIITIPHQVSQIDTIPDLIRIARTDSHQIIMYNFQIETLNESHPKIGTLDRDLLDHFNRRQKIVIGNISVQIKRMNTGKYVMIDARSNLEIHQQIYARIPMHIAENNIGSDFHAILFRKKSTLVKPFNLIITKLRESGVPQRWKQKSFHKYIVESRKEQNLNKFNFESNSEKSDFKVLKRFDLFSIFYLWGMGCLVGMTIFLLEIVTFVKIILI